MHVLPHPERCVGAGSVAGWIASAGLLLGGLLWPLAACQPKPVTAATLNQEIEDAAITSAVKTKMVTEELSDLSDVRVETIDQKVHLTGVVPTLDEKRRAHELALEVPRVMTVINRLDVREGPQL